MTRAYRNNVTQSKQADEEPIFVEPRWPIALAISFFIAISITLRIVQPHRESLGPHWLVPGIEIGMLVALLAADPARMSPEPDGCGGSRSRSSSASPRSRWCRPPS